MSFFSQLVMYIGIIGIIFLVGLPIAHINRRKNECSIQIVGGWGLATIVLVCFWLSVFGVAIKKVSIIIFIVTICLYAYLVLTKKKTLKIKIKEYYPIICALLAGILSMFPTLFYNAQSVYGDEFTYICIADFLVDNGYNTSIELSPLYPWLTQMKLYQLCSYRIGSQMLLALFTSIFGVDLSWKVFAPCVGAGIFYTVLNLFWIIERMGYKSKNLKYVLGIMLGFNVPILMWSAILGLLPQVYGFSLSVFLLGIFLNRDNFSISRDDIVFTSAIAASLMMVYNEIVPIICLVLLCLFIKFGTVNGHKWIDLLFVTFKCIIGTLLFMFPYISGAIKAILLQIKSTPGYYIESGVPEYIGYLFSVTPFGFLYENATWKESVFYGGITSVGLLLFIIGFCKLYISKKDMVKEFICITIPFILLGCYFYFGVDNPFGEGKGNTWSIFKLIQYYWVAFIPFAAIFLAEAIQKMNRKVVVIVGVLYISLNVFNLNRLSVDVNISMAAHTGNKKDPIGEYLSLYEEYKEEKGIINIVDAPQGQKKMLAYLLKDTMLAADWTEDGYFGTYGDMEMAEYDCRGKFLFYRPEDQNSIANLVMENGQGFYLDYKEGFYSEESNGQTRWRWVEPDAVIQLKGDGEKVLYKFQVNILPDVIGEAKIKIYDNEELVLEIPILACEYKTVELVIDTEVNENHELRFVYEGMLFENYGGDSRNLTYCISNMSTELASDTHSSRVYY